MASLALGFVGTVAGGLIGGPLGAQIGGMIGASLGGMLDNQLFPQKQQGPRLSDLSVQVSTYGQVIQKLYGPENRITGERDLQRRPDRDVAQAESGGKGGGPSVSVTTYTYSTNIAVALCDAQRRPISRRRQDLGEQQADLFPGRRRRARSCRIRSRRKSGLNLWCMTAAFPSCPTACSRARSAWAMCRPIAAPLTS
jgi:hypothetical protein